MATPISVLLGAPVYTNRGTLKVLAVEPPPYPMNCGRGAPNAARVYLDVDRELYIDVCWPDPNPNVQPPETELFIQAQVDRIYSQSAKKSKDVIRSMSIGWTPPVGWRPDEDASGELTRSVIAQEEARQDVRERSEAQGPTQLLNVNLPQTTTTRTIDAPAEPPANVPAPATDKVAVPAAAPLELRNPSNVPELEPVREPPTVQPTTQVVEPSAAPDTFRIGGLEVKDVAIGAAVVLVGLWALTRGGGWLRA